MDQTDPLPSPVVPDTAAHSIYLQFIPLLKSGIVTKMLTSVVVIVLARIGAHWAPAEQQELVANIIAFGVIVCNLLAVRDRVTKPTPPLAPNAKIASLLNAGQMASHFMAPHFAAITAATADTVATVQESSMGKLFIGAVPSDIVIDLIIKQGTNGDKSKQAARATEALQIIASARQALSGDVADAVNTLSAVVLNPKDLSPGEALAISNIMAIAAVKLQAWENLKVSGLLDAGVSAAINAVLDEMAKVCQAYITPAVAAVGKPA